MKLAMEGWLTGEAIGRWPILILTGKEDYLFLIMIRDFSSPNEYTIKIEIPSFSGNLDIESFLDWVYEVEKFFDMAYVSEEKHVKFIAYKVKGGAAAWVGSITNHKETSRQTTRDNGEVHEATLQGRFLLPDYQQIPYNQFEHCQQGTRIVMT